jgi:hypothetical protein
LLAGKTEEFRGPWNVTDDDRSAFFDVLPPHQLGMDPGESFERTPRRELRKCNIQSFS